MTGSVKGGICSYGGLIDEDHKSATFHVSTLVLSSGDIETWACPDCKKKRGLKWLGYRRPLDDHWTKTRPKPIGRRRS